MEVPVLVRAHNFADFVPFVLEALAPLSAIVPALTGVGVYLFMIA